MLAELSTRKMNRSPVSCVPRQPGRSNAKIKKATNKSCRNSKMLLRNRCQMLLTCRSSIDLCHKYVLGTSSGCRLSFRKYNSTITGGNRRDHEPLPGGEHVDE